MKSAGLRIRIEPQLRDAFVIACRSQDLTAAQVLRAFMRRYVDERSGEIQVDMFPVLDGSVVVQETDQAGSRTL